MFAYHHPAARQSRQGGSHGRSEEHTSELQSQSNLVCRLLLEKKKKTTHQEIHLTNDQLNHCFHHFETPRGRCPQVSQGSLPPPSLAHIVVCLCRSRACGPHS